ncbi:hypothetical protein [Bacillus testis]|uniref:hypothetical protein n=1 Tax=Bacillus testis TaxID=1622072 RepID=UPI000AE4673C|nr:hypothetical protein [Bacillus testis]
MLLVGAFGATMLGISLLESSGMEINHGLLTLTMETAKIGGLIYLIKMAAGMFL